MMKRILAITILIWAGLGCQEKINNSGSVAQNLTIFTLNDVHGQLENFAKIKHIVDAERAKGEVLLVVAGDIFSGNPVVDSHEEKGYPLIDVMNKVGVDVTVLGNHEYDYGEEHLRNRIAQAEFEFICANVNTEGSLVSQPDPFAKLTVGDLDIVLLGLVETNGSDNETVPSTHPWRVKNMEFSRPEAVVAEYDDLKNRVNADVYIALTHIGHDGNDFVLGDYQLAEKFPYFDLIIGGHSHREIDTIVNDIPIYQTGSYIRKLGRIDMTVKNGAVESIRYQLIDLESYPDQDDDLASLIAEYNNQPYLKEIIGYSQIYHNRTSVGCFYVDAMRGKMDVDIAFQNSGGVRSDLDEGDITKREIFEISPFNNGTVIYEMSVADIRTFLKETGSGFYYSGVVISQSGTNVIISDHEGNQLDNERIMRVGVNDYIPAVHEPYFSQNGNVQDLTSAETLISYLVEINDQVNYPSCSNFFRFSN